MNDNITVGWANEEKRALLVTYESDNWTWDDLADSALMENALIDSVTYMVDVIIDLRGHRILPKGGSPFKVIQQVRKARHPRHGIFVVVGLRGAIAMLTDLLRRIPDPNDRQVFLVNSVEEALELLRQRSK
ncbi:MAG: hypothetical protein U0694_07440 [Anaerolineae bacterium]